MKRKILVVVDMQNDFITGPLGNEECKKAVEPVVNAIKTGGYEELLITQDTHSINYLETQEGKKLPVVHCIKDTEGWQLNPEVEKAVNTAGVPVKYFEKPTFGSVELANFFSQPRDGKVENSEETQIDFCGVCTGICVISNAMLVKAALPEATVRVLADACACVTPDTHKTALDAMKLCQIEVIGR